MGKSVFRREMDRRDMKEDIKVDNPPRRCVAANSNGEQCPFFAVEGHLRCHEEYFGFRGGTIWPPEKRTPQGEEWLKEVNLCRMYWGMNPVGSEQDIAWATNNGATNKQPELSDREMWYDFYTRGSTPAAAILPVFTMRAPWPTGTRMLLMNALTSKIEGHVIVQNDETKE